MLYNDYLLSLLTFGRLNFGFTAVRSEFEAEGARYDEMVALKMLGNQAGLDFTLKIGGCEAVSDLRHAQSLNASAIIAPMIETPFALLKYHQATQRIFPTSTPRPNFYINIETTTAVQNQEAIIHVAKMAGMKGVVFGRIDFAKSQGLPRQWVENKTLTQTIKETAQLCQAEGLDFIVGGGIALESIAALKEIDSVHLSAFETRKISFAKHILHSDKLAAALDHATFFELEWLKAKQSFYQKIAQEDTDRITLLEKRLKLQEESAKQVV